MSDEIEAEVTTTGIGVNANHLVRYGAQMVSVTNLGMISLPAITRPEDIDELCGALQAAKDVGVEQQETNQKAQADSEAKMAQAREKAEEARQNAIAGRAPGTDRARARAARASTAGPRGAKRTAESEKERQGTAPRKRAAAKKAPAKAAAKRPQKADDDD